MSAAADTGLEEWMQADIDAAGMKSPVADSEIHDALRPVKGLRRITVTEEKISICYDPLRTTAHELSDAITSAGHRVRDIRTARISPLT